MDHKEPAGYYEAKNELRSRRSRGPAVREEDRKSEYLLWWQQYYYY